MKKIPSTEVNIYIAKGFKEETRYTKGTDGIRTYTVLTKKNDFGTRVKNFFSALAKTLFSFGAALKDQKTLDKWHTALSKKIVVEVIFSESKSVIEPIKTEESKKEEPRPAVVDSLKESTQPKEPPRMGNGPPPSLLELCLQVATQRPTLKTQLLPAEVANKVLAKILEEDSLNPLALNLASDADELSLSMNISPATFSEILESCPKLTTINFNSFAEYSLEDFNANVALLLKFKEKQPALTVSIDSEHFDEKVFYKFFLILKTQPSFLEALTPLARNLFFIDLFKLYPKFNIDTRNLCKLAINGSLSDDEIDKLVSSILSNLQPENSSRNFNRVEDFITLIKLLSRKVTTMEVLFKQEDVLTILGKLLTDEKKGYVEDKKWKDNTNRFLRLAFATLSNEQYKNLFARMLKSTSEDEKIPFFTKFLSYSVINCSADVVLERIAMVLKGENEEAVIPSIFDYLILPIFIPSRLIQPPKAELNFYLVWNSIRQGNGYELLKSTLDKLGPKGKLHGENLIFLKLLAEKCDPIHCDGILNLLTRNNYKQSNRDALITLFLNTILSRNNNELIEKAFSAYWKNYPELLGSQLPGVLPNIKSLEHLLIILKAIPDDLDDENKKKICQAITR